MIFKQTLSNALASKLFCFNKILSPFSIWKKSPLIKSNVYTEHKKGFHSDIKNNGSKNEIKQNIIIPVEKQVVSSNFLNQKKKVQKIKIRVRSLLNNPQQFLFQSKFHLKNTDFSEQLQQICKLDERIFNKTEKQELTADFVEINQERKKIIIWNMTRENIYQQLMSLNKKSEETIKIRNYVSLYNKICGSIQKILNRSQEEQDQQSDFTQRCILNIVASFNFLEFYIYYLLKLLRIKDKENVAKMHLHQANLCWFIIQKLSEMEFSFMNNKMPYDLQRYVQQFFEKKLPLIITKSKINSNAQKYLVNKNTNQNVGQQIQLLMKLEKVFHKTHLTHGKHNFYANFMKRHKSTICNMNDTPQNTKKRLNRFIELMYLTTQNMFLDSQTINAFEKILIQISQHSNPEFYVTQQGSKLLFDIYQKVGLVPNEVYDTFLAEYIYNRVSIDQYHLVRCIKFYVYSQCDDQLLLKTFFSKLDNLINSNQFRISKKSKHLLHFLFHYLCIKYPNLIKNKISKKILASCNSHTTKDHFVLGEIMKSVKMISKTQGKKHQTERFFSYCIQWQSKKIENNIKSELSTLQQKIFKESLEKVIQKLNSDPNQNCFYEIKQNFSFCSFQLDFVVLKWQSEKKQRLLDYLDSECIGLQYSYDKHDCENDIETAKKMQELTLIDYEKGLEFIRKKKVRQQILKHYGWKILYVPNKFLYQRHINRERFQEKLKQAIQMKFSV